MGIIDASYLTYEHYANVIPPCTINRFLPFFSDCGAVLRSKYAIMFGLPVALLGFIHYTILTIAIALAITTNKKLWWFWVFFQTAVGAIFSLYLMYLQFVIIKSLCIYCTLSALISFTLFILAFFWLDFERKTIFIYSTAGGYQWIFKPIFFLINPEIIHEFILNLGQFLGKYRFSKNFIRHSFHIFHPCLQQKIAGITFQNPVGLAAGFDYQAKLPQILPSLGFGFGTVGTITNMPYAGNPPPRLGRLPKSKSLMVNKGFKNEGANKVIKKLENKKLEIPIGISVGRTNSPKLPTQKKSVEDIVEAFKKFEKSDVKHSYYELNISCPNIIHGKNITFYPPKNLQELLSEVEKLGIKKPIFIKMPIEKNDQDTLAVLEVITKYSIKGVIFGNLQTHRRDPSLDPNEVKKFKVGKFSGKPCEKRSNELIKLAYEHYGKKLIIIGCGGIFSAQDAYQKIKLGATLVQLITGMVYQGPQLAAQINLELNELLKKDGFKNIKDAIGVAGSSSS